MGGKSRVCEICGIREKHSKRFFANFPLNEYRCKEWVRATGKEDLVHIPIEKLHEIRFVCIEHFEKDEFNKKGSRLLKNAIPTLQLFASPLTDEQLEEFPLHVASKKESEPKTKVQRKPTTRQKKIRSSPVRKPKRRVQSVHSTSRQGSPSCDEQDATNNLQPNYSTIQQKSPSNAEQDSTTNTPHKLSASQQCTPSCAEEDSTIVVQHDPLTRVQDVPEADQEFTIQILQEPLTSQQGTSSYDGQHFTIQVLHAPSSTEQGTTEQGTSNTEQDFAINVTNEPMEDKQDTLFYDEQDVTTNVDYESSTRQQGSPSYVEQDSALNVQHETLTNQQNLPSNAVRVLQEGTKKRKLEDNIDMPPIKKLIIQVPKTNTKLSSTKKTPELREKVNSAALKNLVAAELKNKKKKPQGRRWTLKEKISALAIFKKSPQTYRYLRRALMLPCIKTLQNLLTGIPIETGIKKRVLKHLQRVSSTMDEKNKCCALLFSEFALVYNEANDQVDGNRDIGETEESETTIETADHALVFMIQSLCSRYKKLVAYYFVRGTVSPQQLATYINQLIKALNGIGFNIMVTACDQSPTNVEALKLLKGHTARSVNSVSIETRNFFVTDDGKKIYIMYDVPNLFVSLRDDFIKYGQIQIENNIGKWSYLYEVEELNKSLLHLSKITSAHVRPKYQAKTKVKYAAQALSNTVSAVLKLMSQAESDERRKNEMMQTALVIEQLDRLFDCTNGPSCIDDIKRGQRQNVSAKTNHAQVWNDFRIKLSNLKFIMKNGTGVKNLKCIRGMLISLRTLQDLWTDLCALGFRYLNLRSLNQDGLENYRHYSPP